MPQENLWFMTQLVVQCFTIPRVPLLDRFSFPWKISIKAPHNYSNILRVSKRKKNQQQNPHKQQCIKIQPRYSIYHAFKSTDVPAIFTCTYLIELFHQCFSNGDLHLNFVCLFTVFTRIQFDTRCLHTTHEPVPYLLFYWPGVCLF